MLPFKLDNLNFTLLTGKRTHAFPPGVQAFPKQLVVFIFKESGLNIAMAIFLCKSVSPGGPHLEHD
jgi:hypothetical protein